MATSVGGPWSVLFPVNFVAKGDTVHQGFNKHIQEIARIYGLLNALDAGKITEADLIKALNDKTHNSLQGLQGGSSAERYHLTKAQVEKVDNAAAASDIIKNHNSLSGLQGGSSTERYHLTKAQVEKLNGAAAASDIIKNHNSLSGLQGGSSTERYHLTKAQVDGLDKLVSGGSINDNGYVVFPSGLMMQWGQWSFAATHDKEVIRKRFFPTTFPDKCFTVSVTTRVRLKDENLNTKDYNDVDISFAAVIWDTSSCNVLMQDFSGALGDISSAYACFVAFGK